MNKKAKTKAQNADEDANLDEALAESFPASDPLSMIQPRTGADEKTEETSEGRSNPTRDKAKPPESDGTVAFAGW